MTAEPIRDDPLDPQLIVADLPEDERAFFLSQYREALEDARDPAGWQRLRRVLRLWRMHADAAGSPGYQQALDAARSPAGNGMALDEAVHRYRPAS
jgi:hypothetical protein